MLLCSVLHSWPSAHTGGKQQQYAWNGNRIVAINQDLLNEGYTAAGAVRQPDMRDAPAEVSSDDAK